MLRSHTCGELRAEHAGQRVTLCGWVLNRRDHGGLLFLDLRDRYGITQCRVEPDAGECVSVADRVRLEWVVRASGTVHLRPDENRNPDRETGAVEVVIDDFEVLSRAEPPPVAVTGEERSSEELGLRYRYLELRRPEVRRALEVRAHVNRVVRDHMHENEFIEVETPILLKSTPEGARDYLVPSRVHPGSFYALPQSPQLLKQILMIGGLDRYWQIARCFRDEDLRADRQPEFTQLDIEMSFVEEADVQAVQESLLRRLASEIRGIELPDPLPRLSYAEAMATYGTDKPDLRFGLPVQDVTDTLAGSAFVVFKGAIEAGGRVRAIALPPEHTPSRKQLDALPAVVVDRGARGVAWAKVREDGWSGPVAKHLTDEERAALCEATGCVDGGTLLFLAGPHSVVEPASGDLRLHLGQLFGLRDPSRLEALWVTEFPMYEVDEETGGLVAKHHPFTAPVPEDVPLLESDPASARARAYDLVLNGEEIAGGSIRIHDREVQGVIFRNLGIEAEEAEERFGFFVEALRYGVPPHGGIAWGLDRVIATLAGREQIRDVIAFPKTTSAADLMTAAPSRVDADQLEELHIALVSSADKAESEAETA
jgi:aspartyl-tRNA synthetase